MRYQKHTEKCSRIPDIVYNFSNQNLVSFEDNIGNKGDLTLVAYIGFETTAPAENFLNREQKTMFVVSYTLIFAFHLKFNSNHVVVQRSSGHLLLKLVTIDYLTKDQLEFVDKDLVQQLKDCVISVSETKCKTAVAQIFAVKLKFALNCLLKWLNRKFKI